MKKYILYAVLAVSLGINLIGGVEIFSLNKELSACASLLKYNSTLQEERRGKIFELYRLIEKYRPELNHYVRYEWSKAFLVAGEEFNINPKLLIAVSIIESGITHVGANGHTLISNKGAEGIMQVMPKYWANGAIPFIRTHKDLRHPTLNIKAGAFVLKYYMDMYKDTRLALIAYNRGQGVVNRDIRLGIDPANGFAKRVLKRADYIMGV